MPQHTGSDPVAVLHATLARSLATHVPPGAGIAVALSGGRDSVVLLDALAGIVASRGHALSAIHVHHGLSPYADDWVRFSCDLCAARVVPLTVRRVTVPRVPQASLEGDARRHRYEALSMAALEAGARYVALAHHRDDQAETLLLQLLRGAGPHGLAGMADARPDPRGVTWWRPLLGVPRAAIEAYAQAAGLAWVDDDSNASPRHRRNALRHIVFPALATAGFPQAGAALGRAAAHQADAMRLADELAALDAREAWDGNSLDRAALGALPAHRARNLLRWFLHGHGLAMPSTARLAAMLGQVTGARDDARVRIAHDGRELGVHRGRVHVHAPAPAAFDLPWSGQPALGLPHGILACSPAATATIALDAQRLVGAELRVRLRAGGERIQLAPNRPRRSLKAILHDAGMPAWDRLALPLLFRGEALVAVPGVGVAADWQPPKGAPGLAVVWHPARV